MTDEENECYCCSCDYDGEGDLIAGIVILAMWAVSWIARVVVLNFLLDASIGSGGISLKTLTLLTIMIVFIAAEFCFFAKNLVGFRTSSIAQVALLLLANTASMLLIHMREEDILDLIRTLPHINNREGIIIFILMTLLVAISDIVWFGIKNYTCKMFSGSNK